VIRPDYEGGSIVNLMRSLGDACGALPPLPYAPLRDAKVSLGDTARHVVLLVADGLGYRYLQRHGAGGHLHNHLQARLTSVFPSTTASAVTTYLTGLAPQQHALTGWHMYFSELDAVAAVLPLRPRGPGEFDARPAHCRNAFSAMRPLSIASRDAAFSSPRKPSPVRPSIFTTAAVPRYAATRRWPNCSGR
jgi:Uncharacterized proteins of the AP superfamily